jgi:hypothetical protein
MPLVKPTLPPAEPGRPITAQGWNEIVDAVGELYDAVNAIGSGTLEVNVTSGGQPVLGAVVVATPAAGGNPILAVPPVGSATVYNVGGVSDGAWHVDVIASGFEPAARDVTVPSPRVDVELTAVGPAVPDLFGQPLQTAFGALTAANLPVGLILDALGKEVPRTPIPADYQNVPVLAQLPPAGTRLAPSGRVHLVVAATVTQPPIVTMPNLAGLTQTEATRVLEQLGLRVGNISFVNTAS